jgi:hypothetical protein
VMESEMKKTDLGFILYSGSKRNGRIKNDA